eukprot:COSAG02_NODE_4814_length_4948_cov_5.576614_4_plen_114_part_00
MAGGAGQARMLALQLEQLTREASGFQARLASVSSENTRLKRELKQHRGGAQTERHSLKKLESELKVRFTPGTRPHIPQPASPIHRLRTGSASRVAEYAGSARCRRSAKRRSED